MALLPLFQDLPQPVLGAIVISAVIGFLRVAEMQRIASLRRDSFWLAVTALVATLLLGWPITTTDFPTGCGPVGSTSARASIAGAPGAGRVNGKAISPSGPRGSKRMSSTPARLN